MPDDFDMDLEDWLRAYPQDAIHNFPQLTPGQGLIPRIPGTSLPDISPPGGPPFLLPNEGARRHLQPGQRLTPPGGDDWSSMGFDSRPAYEDAFNIANDLGLNAVGWGHNAGTAQNVRNVFDQYHVPGTQLGGARARGYDNLEAYQDAYRIGRGLGLNPDTWGTNPDQAQQMRDYFNSRGVPGIQLGGAQRRGFDSLDDYLGTALESRAWGLADPSTWGEDAGVAQNFRDQIADRRRQASIAGNNSGVGPGEWPPINPAWPGPMQSYMTSARDTGVPYQDALAYALGAGLGSGGGPAAGAAGAPPALSGGILGAGGGVQAAPDPSTLFGGVQVPAQSFSQPSLLSSQQIAAGAFGGLGLGGPGAGSFGGGGGGFGGGGTVSIGPLTIGGGF